MRKRTCSLRLRRMVDEDDEEDADVSMQDVATTPAVEEDDEE